MGTDDGRYSWSQLGGYMNSYFTDELHSDIPTPFLSPGRSVLLLMSRPLKEVPRDVTVVGAEQGRALVTAGVQAPSLQREQGGPGKGISI